MEIIWHGQSCFTIKGKEATIVTDPYGDTGIALPKLTADILSIGTQNKNYRNISAVKGDPRILDWPGEYEVKGIHVAGIEFGKNIIFVFDIEGINICHLGTLGEKLTNEATESIGNVDILLIPVGGNETFTAKDAHDAVEQIDPRVVIPMHFHIEGMDEKNETIEKFLKEIGKSSEEKAENLRIKRIDLPEDETKFVILEAITGRNGNE